MSKLIRVFPRKTNASPDDEDVRFGFPGLFDEADEVHVSCAFKWDIPLAEQLAIAWEAAAPTLLGGPALGSPAGEFMPGLYLKYGYLITSRGCPNKCWFCDAWKREGDIRELPIKTGNNILDNNLLACSDSHVKAVFEMLESQPNVQFTGGLEAARLRDWHVNALLKIKPKQLFFAYDSPEDYEPLVSAGRKLLSAGFTRASHKLRAYVLFGYEGDSPIEAQKRFQQTIKAGFMPMPMFYRPDGFRPMTREWHELQFSYSRPWMMRREYHKYMEPS